MTAPDYSLEDIRQHPAFPFPDWQDDDFQFLMLELYWAERVREVLGEDLAEFAPLFDTERDGNPIITLTRAKDLRGLRLVVIENEEGKPPYPDATGPDAFYPLYAFMNEGRLPDGETPVNELVLLVALDERMGVHVDAFLRWHCLEEVAPGEMETLIARFETEFSQGGPEDDAEDDATSDP